MKLGVGRENAVTQADLARSSGFSVREIQAAIQEARLAGKPVCSGDEGIWLAKDSAEWHESNERLRSRVLTQLRTYSRQKRGERRMKAAEEHVEQPDFGLVA